MGFKKALNYPFVVGNPVTSAQIFAFLPDTLNSPFDNAFTNITVARLGPLKVSSRDYLLTVAEVYFPSAQVENLQKLIQNDASKFYFVNGTSRNVVASLVDATIPLTGLLQDDGSTTSETGSESGSPSNTGSSSNEGTDSSEQSSHGNLGTLGSSQYLSLIHI